MKIPTFSLRPLLILLALAALFAAPRAFACGGFFCNTQSPVNQAAERVLYIQQGADITVHIQIRYQGPAEKFSWVLPLQAVPTVTTGSDAIFAALENATRPSYSLQYEPGDANCAFPICQYAMAASSDGATGGTKGANGVVVLQEANVGPFESKVISGETGADLQAWLTANGYDQPKATTGLLDAYAKEKFVFLALRLQKDKTDGDLVPIVLKMKELSPCLPLRLTQLAATPDMPVYIWTMGPARAVPKNWLHVVLNEKAIDWLSNGGNYLTVASKAIDQASGHAFTTELAQKAANVSLQFGNTNWNPTAMAAVTDPGKYLNQLLMTLGNGQAKQLQPIIKKFIAKVAEFAATSDQEYYQCLQNDCCYQGACQSGYQCYGNCGAIKLAASKQAFDSKAMTKAIQDEIVQPLQDVQKAWAETAYLTRLMTLVSPEEMNKDPIFAWNKDLPAVKAQHMAKAAPICISGSKEAVRAEITLENGDKFQVPVPIKKDNEMCWGAYSYYGQNDGKGPLLADGGQPAAKVQVLDESGQPIEIEPTVADKVDAQLNEAKVGTPSLPADFLKSLPAVTWNPNPTAAAVSNASGGTSAGGGCSAGGSSGGAGLVLLALGGLFLLRRRPT